MKKFLIFSISLISSIFIFTNNVKAAEVGSSTDYVANEDELIWSKTYTGSPYHTQKLYIHDNKIIYCSTYNNYGCRKEVSLDDYTYITIPTNGNNNNSSNLYLTQKPMSVEYSSYYNKYFITLPYNEPAYYIYCTMASNTMTCYDYSFPNGTTSAYSGLTFDAKNLTSLSSNYNFYDSFNDKNYPSNIDYNTSPSINITELNSVEIETNFGQTLTSSKIFNINFSSFNLNKYKYLYSLDFKKWTEITENDYQFLINKNLTIYVKVTDLNDEIITSSTFTVIGINENILDYTIEDGTEYGKKLTIFYYNFNKTDYFIIDNFQSGTEKKYNSEEVGTIVYDNIALDNTFTITAYDKDDNFIISKNIDIQSDVLKESGNRYIRVNINKETKRIIFSYENTKKNDKCYYKFSNDKEEEVNCNDQIMPTITKNIYIEIYIKNDNEIVIKRGITLNFFNNLPVFTFDSYYSDSESKQILKIIVDNLKTGDRIYYSYDKENWTELESKRINTLEFYTSAELYFKVVRNNEIVSEAYFDLVYNSFVNSSQNNDLSEQKGLKGLLNYFKQITSNVSNDTINYGTNIYNSLKNSKFGLYILLIVVSSILILVMKSIKR